MSVAERLTSRGLRTFVLPASGETVSVHHPRGRDLFAAGIFPLLVAKMDLEKYPPDEREQVLKEADRQAVRLICECSHEPKIVKRTPRPGEVHIDTLLDEDFAEYHAQILDLMDKAKERPSTETAVPKEEQFRRELALCCKLFAIDPTEAENWPQERLVRLFEYGALAVKKNG